MKQIHSLIFISILLFACQKSKEPDGGNGLAPDFQIGLERLAGNRANAVCVIANFENLEGTFGEVGFEWAVDTSFASNFQSKAAVPTGSFFQTQITFDSPDKTYLVRAFANYNGKIYKSRFEPFVVSPGTWRRLENFPGTPKTGAATFIIDEKAYFVGGNSREVWQFDPATGAWTRKKDTPINFLQPFAFAIDGFGYAGGESDDVTTVGPPNFFKYDPNTDEWTPAASLNQFLGGVMGKAVAVGYKGKGYVFSSGLYVFDPILNKWSLGDLDQPVQHRRQLALLRGDELLLIGGVLLGQEPPFNYTSFSENLLTYDFLTGKLSSTPLTPNFILRYDLAGFAIGSRLYYGYGVGVQEFSVPDFTEFTSPAFQIPQNQPFFPDFPTNFRGAVGFSINGKGYLGLGKVAADLFYAKDNISFWEFTP